MRPFSPFSRKPLLLLGFISVFIFLYNVASHPRVEKTMQPTAYYNDYDEAVCLPDRVLKKQPPHQKAKAAIVILVRNSEQVAIAETLENFQDKFNNNFDYPYVFLNEQEFTTEFKDAMHQAAPNASMSFGLVSVEHWSYPSWVNQTYAQECRERMDAENVFYGGLESYHHMCRYQSGFFFNHPLLENYDWYWRVEPGVRFYCDITYDPFLYMQKYNKQYGFVVTLLELRETIPTLWKTVKEYARSRRLDLSEKKSSLFPYFEDDNGDYNLCHFWSNFEIASLNLWRSPSYRDFFNYLDQTGNFFYERWGDAPVHSLAAGLFLSTDEIHYFEDFGYQHDKYRHCPSKESGLGCRCECPEGTTDESIDHDQHYDTCLPKWRDWVKKSNARKKGWRNVWA
ncbi:nucleotide-diphospho-sugar transferase [Radiomyces spectabilis]|uniref:nucleotide-diphospho-sugar transferase n=1 Tax=Radiomyces spectabilis TaxID=64574 RepID=UPI00221EF153|nr:nucleotide-diphospho-sugar transferase [Radiomyces spectabilis]KAI8365998.1 nucleotide-diphospho-sugar transferase [Radiomyces spectabilis]